MNSRLKELRKNILKLTLKEFGTRIDLSIGGLSDIERGRTPLQERHIKLICKEFNVNENWLKNGIEPIFIETEKDILNTLKDKYSLDNMTINLLETFIKLDDFSKKTIINFLIKSIENYYSNHTDKLEELYDKINSLPKDTVKIVARGEGITEISQEEFDRITKNAIKLDPEDYDKYF